MVVDGRGRCFGVELSELVVMWATMRLLFATAFVCIVLVL